MEKQHDKTKNNWKLTDLKREDMEMEYSEKRNSGKCHFWKEEYFERIVLEKAKLENMIPIMKN